MALEVLFLKILVLLLMLSNIQWWFGKKETALVFSRDKAKGDAGKRTGDTSSCSTDVHLKGTAAARGTSDR